MAFFLALSSVWMEWAAAMVRPAMVQGVIFFIAHMFLMFLGSTIFHLLPPPWGDVRMVSCAVSATSAYTA